VTVGKWSGLETMMKGGFGVAAESVDTLEVAAAAVVNAGGDVLADDGTVLAGARSAAGEWLVARDRLRRPPGGLELEFGTNTTLVVVATNATLAKIDCHRLAQRAHDGLAIAIRPVHTTRDGDAAFALATGRVTGAPYDLVANMAVEVVAEAIRNAVRHARTVAGVPGLAG
jgi:L-aminopeptidase/D-esterase-like protein